VRHEQVLGHGPAPLPLLSLPYLQVLQRLGRRGEVLQPDV
jgi:hypothetical protein